MDDSGEQMSIVNDAAREHQGEQSIESSIDAAAIDVKTQELFLMELRNDLSTRYPELLFSMASGVANSASTQVIPTMLITPTIFHRHSPYGLVPHIQVSVQCKVYTVSVLMRVWKKETLGSCDELDSVCKIIGSNTKHKFCPGIEMNRYMTDYYESISFHIKSARVSTFPFHRVDSQKCDLYLELAHNASRVEKESSDVLCYPCKCLVNHLERQKNSSRNTNKEVETSKSIIES